jgi:DNA-binding SARP family transcriptional activator
VELLLFGPVEIRVHGNAIDVGPPQRRKVLAALAMEAGRPVSANTLIHRVWDAEPSNLPRRALHAHISRIRRAIESVETGLERPARVVHLSGAYMLDIEPERVDMCRFERLAQLAGLSDRTDAQRVALLREALTLWQDAPLQGLAGQWTAQVRQRWSLRRLDVLVAWARAELRSRPDAPIVTTLQELTTEYPLSEPLVAALMRALYAAGRRAEAVDCYASTRRRFIDQLGIEPGMELRSVHESILRGECPKAP